ncbi:hypothetical protein O0I10_012683 [Lichtheimia ornata]|uniref:Uncharacterized protein n=1 Tax=Lichtheimia ornata TaxID=688661 RepID=A0AAD7XT07_9FUNG|nr:uncharacterized protein O0I10_012683 [Lichtheimia ornata]KAJ8651756.1 hypothetical protein O0I10_012683 [Lichtheimia ornata]
MCNGVNPMALALKPSDAHPYFAHRFQDEDYHFAFVEWYNPSRHAWPTHHIYGLSACQATTQPISMLSIIPVHYIHSVVSLSNLVDDHLLVKYLPRKIKSEY